MFSKKNIDATQGPFLPQMFRYALPLLLSFLVQRLFDSVDIAVLGNLADTASVAAVGSTSIPRELFFNFFYGITSGISVILARALGAQDREKVKQSVDTGIVFALSCGIVLAVLGWFFTPALMTWNNCPADCFDGAVLSLRIYFLTAPVLLLQNSSSSMLTTSGNTRSSLYFMLAGGTTKVVATILLCLLLPNKVLAVSLGTTISQLLWATLSLRRLCSGLDPVHLQPSNIKPHLPTLKRTVAQGFPIGLYSCLFPLANMQIQSAINSFGSVVMAGNSAAIAMEAMASSFISANASICSVFVGQNLGAEKPERVRRSAWLCLGIDAILITAICVGAYLTNRLWLGLLLPGNPAAAEYALLRMSVVLRQYSFYGLTVILGQILVSFGYSFLSSINSVICVFGIRIAWMTFVYPRYQTYRSLVTCFPFSWLGLFILSSIMVLIVFRRYRKGLYKRF